MVYNGVLVLICRVTLACYQRLLGHTNGSSLPVTAVLWVVLSSAADTNIEILGTILALPRDHALLLWPWLLVALLGDARGNVLDMLSVESLSGLLLCLLAEAKRSLRLVIAATFL